MNCGKFGEFVVEWMGTRKKENSEWKINNL